MDQVYNFCDECGETLLYKQTPSGRQEALGRAEGQPNWCPKCKGFQQAQGRPGSGME